MVETLQWNTFSFLRDYRQRQIFEINEKVTKAMGPADSKINPGIAAIQFLVNKEYMKELELKHKKELERARKWEARWPKPTAKKEEDEENLVQRDSLTRTRPSKKGHVAVTGCTGTPNAVRTIPTASSSGTGKGQQRPPWRQGCPKMKGKKK